MKPLLFGAVVGALFGCASSEDNLRRATAISVPGNALPDQIVIEGVDRGALTVTWTGIVNGRAYACSADDMVRRPYCSARR